MLLIDIFDELSEHSNNDFKSNLLLRKHPTNVSAPFFRLQMYIALYNSDRNHG